MFKLKKLNSFGVSHILVPLVAIVVIGGIGSYVAFHSKGHADPSCVNDFYGYGGAYSGAAFTKNSFCIASTNTQWGYKLVFQGDGNLVFYQFVPYKGFTKPLWASGTTGKVSSTGTLELQKDGNVVIYDKSGTGRRALWASGTNKGSYYSFYQLYIYGGKLHIKGERGSTSTALWTKP